MSVSASNTNAYKQQQILTASPEQLILMLYNGCIRFINESAVGIEQENIEKTHNSCVKAQDIVTELIVNLNMDYPISKELFDLYEYTHYELVQANLKKDKQRLLNAKTVITNLRDGWAEAMKIARAEGTNQSQNIVGDSVISV